MLHVTLIFFQAGNSTGAHKCLTKESEDRFLTHKAVCGVTLSFWMKWDQTSPFPILTEGKHESRQAQRPAFIQMWFIAENFKRQNSNFNLITFSFKSVLDFCHHAKSPAWSMAPCAQQENLPDNSHSSQNGEKPNPFSFHNLIWQKLKTFKHNYLSYWCLTGGNNCLQSFLALCDDNNQRLPIKSWKTRASQQAVKWMRIYLRFSFSSSRRTEIPRWRIIAISLNAIAEA